MYHIYSGKDDRRGNRWSYYILPGSFLFLISQKIVLVTGVFDNSLVFLLVTHLFFRCYRSFSLHSFLSFLEWDTASESWLSEFIVVCSHFEGAILVSLSISSLLSKLCSSEESNDIILSLLSIGLNIAFKESCSTLWFDTFLAEAKSLRETFDCLPSGYWMHVYCRFTSRRFTSLTGKSYLLSQTCF